METGEHYDIAFPKMRLSPVISFFSQSTPSRSENFFVDCRIYFYAKSSAVFDDVYFLFFISRIFIYIANNQFLIELTRNCCSFLFSLCSFCSTPFNQNGSSVCIRFPISSWGSAKKERQAEKLGRCDDSKFSFSNGYARLEISYKNTLVLLENHAENRSSVGWRMEKLASKFMKIW